MLGPSLGGNFFEAICLGLLKAMVLLNTFRSHENVNNSSAEVEDPENRVGEDKHIDVDPEAEGIFAASDDELSASPSAHAVDASGAPLDFDQLLPEPLSAHWRTGVFGCPFS